MDSFHLVMDVIDRVPRVGTRAPQLRQRIAHERLRHRAYTREVGHDPPEVRDWTSRADDTPRSPAPERGARA